MTARDPDDWQVGFSAALERAAFREYQAQLSAHLRRRRAPSTFRYSPPDWHRDAMDALGRNDEAAAKSAKLVGNAILIGARGTL